MELEPSRVYRSLRVVDLRRLRFRRFDRSGAPIAHRPIHSDGKNVYTLRCGHFVALELDLSALAPARFVLGARVRALSSDLLNGNHENLPLDPFWIIGYDPKWIMHS